MQLKIFAPLALATALMATIAYSDIIPLSSDRMISERDLLGMDQATLRLARNEIFARHGYIFKSDELSTYFSQFEWYVPKTRDVQLSDIEQNNVDLIKSYENSPELQERLKGLESVSATSQQVVAEVNVVVQNTSSAPLEVQQEIDQLFSEIEAIKSVLNRQRAMSTDPEMVEARALAEAELMRLLDERTPLLVKLDAQNAGLYDTPVRPTVDMLKLTVRQISELWPRVPYYRPGTQESGEFLLTSAVSDTGELRYILRFFDPNSSTMPVVGELSFSVADVQMVLDALQKSLKASETLKEKGVIRAYEKSMVCFPEADCAAKIEGNTSTEIVFTMNEDGAMGVRLTRNKGSFSEAYGVSLPSAALLASYFDFIIAEGSKEYQAGAMTDADIDALLEE
jgi:uncharacterized coiled-coil protein SlyX